MFIYFIICTLVICFINIEIIHCSSGDTFLQQNKSINIIPEDFIENRLNGGSPTDIENFPFVVSIQKFSIPRCVGSLITESFLITAAHCLVDLNRGAIFILDPYDFTIISGRTVITPEATTGQERQVKQFIIHSRFERLSLKYDVGIVETSEPFILGPSTQPSKLYTMPPEVITFFQSCTLIGWDTGRHNFDDYEAPELNPSSMKLETIKLKVMNFDKCQAILDKLVSMDSVCTHLHEQCPGQSGSPLICGESLYGVFTWTAGCANTSFPAVFVRIAKIYIWVNSVLNGEHIESLVRISSHANQLESVLSIVYFLLSCYCSVLLDNSLFPILLLTLLYLKLISL